MYNTGDVNQRIEKLESSKQSTEDKVHHLQGDYNISMRISFLVKLKENYFIFL